MTFRARGAWLLPLVLAVGCLEDPDNDVEIEVEETKISGGIPTTGHPYVGMIIEPQAGNQAQLCTGWVVGRRHAVTAAHCVSNRVGAIRFVEDDGTIQVTDAIAALGFLFSGGSAPTCVKSADVDDDGKVALTDPLNLLNFLFLSAPPPPAPFGTCGADPTPDDLECVEFAPCAQ